MSDYADLVARLFAVKVTGSYVASEPDTISNAAADAIEAQAARIAALVADLESCNAWRASRLARIAELEAALRDLAQSVVWLYFGECRGFSDGPPLPINKAIEIARAALQEKKNG